MVYSASQLTSSCKSETLVGNWLSYQTVNDVCHYGYLQWIWPNTQFSADLVTFTVEILDGKLHFLCSDVLPGWCFDILLLLGLNVLWSDFCNILFTGNDFLNFGCFSTGRTALRFCEYKIYCKCFAEPLLGMLNRIRAKNYKIVVC